MSKRIEISWTEVVERREVFTVPDDFDPSRPEDAAYGDDQYAALYELICESLPPTPGVNEWEIDDWEEVR